MICFHCRDLGMPEGCPECGKVLQTAHAVAAEVTPAQQKSLGIPEYYQDKIWDKTILEKSYVNASSDMLFQKYTTQLTRIYDMFAAGRIPQKSFIVIAPRNSGKLVWAYSCIKQALAHGYTATPIIDNTQLKRLNIISSDRISSKFLKQVPYSIEDFLYSDVVFLTIDPDNFQTSYRTIDSIINKRARCGKPTFILSRYSLSQMSLLDYTDSFSDVVYKPLEDANKSLVVIGR